jgi:tetratricopeptide (TPR) repeat protein
VQEMHVYGHAQSVIPMKKKNFAKAYEDYEQQVKLSPKNAIAYSNRGSALFKNGKLDAAISDFDQSIKLDPSRTIPVDYRAAAYARLGKIDLAREDYRKVISMLKDSKDAASAHLELGRLSESENDLQNALREIEIAVELKPDFLFAIHDQLSILIRMSRFDDAIKVGNRLIEMAPNDAQAFSYRGAAWQGLNAFDRGLDDANQAVRLAVGVSREPGIWTNRANLLRETGEFAKSFADYETAISIDPQFAGAYNGRGLTWRATDDLERSVADFTKALQLDSKYADAYVNRGLALEATGRNEEAREEFQKAVVLPGKNLFSTRFREIAKARLAVLRADKEPTLKSEEIIHHQEEIRTALVLGNGKYVHAGTLTNPPNDARLISKSLRDIGFEVIDGFDLDKPSMKQIINNFLGTAAKAKTAVVFYAGHGMQVDGKNYLVPVDFDINAVEDAAAEMVDVDFILSGLDDQIRTNIIILDACRNNPLVDEPKTVSVAGRSISIRSGLATPSGLGAGATLGAGTLLAFATAPGQVALDGDGLNSPFSSALGRHISTPGVEVQQMLTRVRAEVVAATKSKQVPWSNSSLLGEVFLVKAN